LDWDAIGAISEIIGAVAIIITLIYLAVQIRQTTAGIKASAYQTWVNAALTEQSAANSVEVSDAIATGLFNPRALNDKNWVQFASYCHQFITKVESTYYLAQEGIISDAICEKEYDRAASYLSTLGPSQWWQAGARTQFTDEFVRMIEDRMKRPSSFQVYGFTPGKGFHPHA